jgi:hypothetical protein
MRRHFHRLIVLGLICIIAQALALPVASPPSVTLESGALEGTQFGWPQMKWQSSACHTQRLPSKICGGSRRSLLNTGPAPTRQRNSEHRVRSFPQGGHLGAT